MGAGVSHGTLDPAYYGASHGGTMGAPAGASLATCHGAGSNDAAVPSASPARHDSASASTAPSTTMLADAPKKVPVERLIGARIELPGIGSGASHRKWELERQRQDIEAGAHVLQGPTPEPKKVPVEQLLGTRIELPGMGSGASYRQWKEAQSAEHASGAGPKPGSPVLVRRYPDITCQKLSATHNSITLKLLVPSGSPQYMHFEVHRQRAGASTDGWTRVTSTTFTTPSPIIVRSLEQGTAYRFRARGYQQLTGFTQWGPESAPIITLASTGSGSSAGQESALCALS